jgi:hypothetical protein
MPPMSQSPQQQHTPGGAAPAAVGSPGPSPRLIAVRVLDVPSEPDWVGFKLAGYSRHFVDAIKETPYAETGGPCGGNRSLTTPGAMEWLCSHAGRWWLGGTAPATATGKQGHLSRPPPFVRQEQS